MSKKEATTKQRTTCKAKKCATKITEGSYCAVHVRNHRRYLNMDIKGDT